MGETALTKSEIRTRNNEASKRYYWRNAEARRARNRRWREANPDRPKARARAWRRNNHEKVLEGKRRSCRKNKEHINAHGKEYRAANRERLNEWYKARNKRLRREEPQYAVKAVLRVRLGRLVRERVGHTMELAGCTIEQLLAHIEAQFQPGMTWENRGRGGWHIDHIRPCASFDLMDPEQQRACFHYSNLQPLWWYENLRKAAKHGQ